MMKNQEEALKKVLESLLAARAAMHDEANTSAIRELDKAIGRIEECIADARAGTLSADKALDVVGAALKAIPSIAKLLEFLSN